MTDPVGGRPRIAADRAAAIARDLFGIAGPVRELPGERDRNYRIDDPERGAHVLKLANPSEDVDLLRLQNDVLRVLGEAGTEYEFPRVVSTRDGEDLAQTVDADDRPIGVRLLTWVAGMPLAAARPRTPALDTAVGALLGRVAARIHGIDPGPARRELKWDLARAGEVVDGRIAGIADADRRRLVERLAARCLASRPAAAALREGLVHNDGNDHNIVVAAAEAGVAERRIVGLIDFGDLVASWLVGEAAVGAAYAMLDRRLPLDAATAVARGFHESFPLTETEIEALYPLAVLRLCMSVTIATEQRAAAPDNDYLVVSQEAAWVALRLADDIDLGYAHYAMRHACGLEACPRKATFLDWVTRADAAAPLVEPALDPDNTVVFDLGVGSTELGGGPPGSFDPVAQTEAVFARLRSAGAAVGLGRYDETRAWYGGPLFEAPGEEHPRRRTLHVGVDLFREPGTAVHAPYAGTVHSFGFNDKSGDYGPTIILEHEAAGVGPFWTLYGHLTPDSLDGLERGAAVAAGEPFAAIGDIEHNGGWAPHLHFQLMLDLLGNDGDFPGVAAPQERGVWTSVCPDPNLLLRLPEQMTAVDALGGEAIERLRARHVGPSLSVSYRRPLHIVRGHGQWLWDADGQAWLDAVNNVPHVGHSHPRVVEAADLQNRVLNTNTRYLHENLVRYAERLTATMPDPLRVCFFVCSGSEANELALRIARTVTGRSAAITVEGAYHGNTSALIDLSPYKHDGAGGRGAPPWVRAVPMPDPYRGAYAGRDDGAARLADHVRQAAVELEPLGGPAAFFCEPLLGCGGQVVPPDGYLRRAYDLARDAGALAVADEVQIGFGRVGTHLWAFEAQGATPDIVTLGKPIGNGYPLAAVVTTPEIADAFANGMEYFNTFGGNPVACAVGLAVLDVLEDERLQDNAFTVGERLLRGLGELSGRHEIVGDARGVGLYLGLELVRDRDTLEPAAAEAAYVVERVRDHGVLTSTDGPWHNVVKIKPPLCFDADNADRLVEVLDAILAEDPARPGRT